MQEKVVMGSFPKKYEYLSFVNLLCEKGWFSRLDKTKSKRAPYLS